MYIANTNSLIYIFVDGNATEWTNFKLFNIIYIFLTTSYEKNCE